MKLEFVSGLSWPGNPARPNDDAFCHAVSLAAVFDGATSLGEPLLPVDSDAAWIARKGAEGLIAHQDLPPRQALAKATADAEHDYRRLRSRPPRENYELPVASMMLIGAHESDLEFLWFGDCAALVQRPGARVEIVGDALEKRAGEAHRVARLAEKHKLSPAAGINRPEYLESLRRARNHINTAPDRWAFSPDARCAMYVSSKTLAASAGTTVLLCTDGFLALASDYGRYDAGTLFDAALTSGLRALFEELRAIENADADGRKFPRFKTSDDATALIVRGIPSSGGR
jgi:hypothetical protein